MEYQDPPYGSTTNDGLARFVFPALIILLLTANAASAGSLITFGPPANGYFAKDGRYTATLKLSGSADPRTLKVLSGSKDVTAQFNLSSCANAPCTVSGLLMSGAGVEAGRNFLKARVSGAKGSVDSAGQQFSYKAGLGDPTDGSGPPHIIAIQQSFAGAGSITVMTPTPVQMQPCAGTNIGITVFDRISLNTRNSVCYDAGTVAAYLGTLTEADLVFINAPMGSLTADFTAIGGNSDLTNKAGYYAVSYGHASAGTAYEAWQQPGDTSGQVKSVQGNLVNIGCSADIPACAQTPDASFYAFMPTNSQGFSIIPGTAGSPGNPGLPTIYVGNPNKIPSAADQAPPNQKRALNSSTGLDLFSYKTYTPTWTGGSAAGGMYLVTLNRSTLTYQSDQLYVTNCACTNRGNDNVQIAALGAALSNASPNQLFLLTTVGVPFDGQSVIQPLTAQLTSLGVSFRALVGTIPDLFGNPPRPGFSMVGYRPWVLQDMNRSYSTAANTQQGETGALQGILVRKQTAYYEAVNVAPFNVNTLPIYPTGDDYLKNAVSYALGSSEPVPWPQMDTAGKQHAYAYLSQQLISNNLYGGDPTQCSSQCFDVRFYYTGFDASIIYAKTKPSDVQYPGDGVATNNGFALADFTAVQQQLNLESVYLGEVVAYEAYVTQLNSDDTNNVTLALQGAATSVANDLNQMLGIAPAVVAESKVHLAGDILNTIAAFGTFAGLAPETTVLTRTIAGLAGLFDGSGNIMNSIDDASKHDVVPDPYVNQLGDLLAQQSGQASAAAVKYSNNLKAATSVFFNGISSDWFRLQSVALQSINQTYGGWYVPDQAGARTSYLQTMSIAQRTKTWQQLLPQYFVQAGFVDAGTGYRGLRDGTDQNTTVNNFLKGYLGPQTAKINLSDTHSYSWVSRTTNDYGCADLSFIFQKDKFNNTWPDAFGAMLFGTGTDANGLPQLNIDRNFFHDFMQIPWWNDVLDGWQYPLVVQQIDHGDGSWDCAGNNGNGDGYNTIRAAFSGLTASQTIDQGQPTIFLSGTVSGTTGGKTYYPAFGDTVSISISDTTIQAPVGLNGGFAYNFDTSNLPSSGTPYTVTYSYAGRPGSDSQFGFYALNDISTALTVNSPNSVTDLTVTGLPAAAGQPVTLKATVKSPAGTPTGTVNFLNGASSLGSVSLLGDATATMTITSLTAGTHQLSASYTGAGSFRPSTSAPMTVQINKNTLTLNNPTVPSAVPYGTASVTFSGVLRLYEVTGFPPEGDPVSITLGPVSQSGVIGQNGAFSVAFNTTNLPVGNYPIIYGYPGNTNIAAFSLSTGTLTIQQSGAAQFARLTDSPSINQGTNLHLSGNVISPNGATPTGTVTVTINGVDSAPATLMNGTFLADANTSTLPASSTPYQIKYSYSGDGNYLAAADATTRLTVVKVVDPSVFSNLRQAPSIEYGQANVNLSGIVSLAPQTGAALQLTQAGSGADFPINTNALSPSTVSSTYSMWIKTSVKNPQTLLQDSYVTGTVLTLYMQNDQVGLKWNGGNNSDRNWLSTDTSPISDGQWHHIAISFDSSRTVTLYKDGVATTDSLPAQIALFNIGQPMNIGGASSAGIPSFVGEIWNAKMWNITSSASDIKADMLQSYTDAFPAGLLLTTSFDANAQTAVNAVTSQAATALTGTIVSDTLPALAPAPKEQITITIDSVPETVPLGANGIFSQDYPTTAIDAGNYIVEYKYQGNASFSPVADSTTVLTVKPATTTTTVSSSATLVGFGTPVTFTATMASTNATPTGTVTFYDNGAAVSTQMLVAAGQARFTTISLTPGTHAITAVYSGATNFVTSTSPVVTQTISAYQPSFSNLTPAPAISGGALTVTLGGSISAGTAIPSGSVSITVNGASTPASIRVNGSFTASVKTNTLAIGKYPITYTYTAAGSFAGATDASTVLTVGSASTSTLVGSSANPASSGTPVTFTATVTSLGGTPTGSVAFSDGTTQLGTAVLTAGKASLITSGLTVGTHSITAAYDGGSSDFTKSTSPAITQTITAATSAFSNLSASRAIGYATPTIDLAGQISATGPLLQFTQSGTDSSNAGGVILPHDTTGLSTDSATYSMWIKTAVKTQQILFQAANIHPFISMQNDQLAVTWDGSGPAQGWTSNDTTPISDGEWHHIAVSFNQGQITLFKDGVATADSLAVTAKGAATSPINLGGTAERIPSFTGEIWNAKIWSTPSSAADVQADMYQTYAGTLPANLKMLALFDVKANIGINAVNGQSASPTNYAVAAIDSLPLPVSAANEPVSITINNATQTATTDANGAFTAKFTTRTVPVGNYPVQYSYKGNTVLTAASDSTTAITIYKVTPSYSNLTASQSINASTASVTLAGTLQVGGVWPAGTVNILVNGSSTPAAVGDGGSFQASVTTSSLAVGAYPVTYRFDGDANFNGATDATTTITVQAVAAATTTTVTSSDSDADYGESLNFTASVTSQSGTPTGSVLFYDGATQIGSGPLTNGSAILTINSLTPGTHSITAAYDGSNTAFAKSTSPAIVQTINKVTPIFTVLTASQTIDPSIVPSVSLGGAIMVTSGSITGNVNITLNGVTKPAPLGNDGKFTASFDTTTLADDAYTVVYNFASTSLFNSVTDVSTKLTVKKQPIATTTSLTSSANPATYGAKVTFTATVTSTTGIPTGSVTFLDGITPLGAPTLDTNGKATITPTLAPGQHNITAVYAASGSFTASTSPVLVQTIQAPASFSSLVAPSASAGAKAVAFTGVISGTPTTYPDGSNSVTVTVGGLQGAAKPDAATGNFTVTIDVSTLAAGSYPVAYVYAGDSRLTAASDNTKSLTLTSSGPVTPAVTLTINPNPAVAGQTVTLTATVQQVGSIVPTGNVTFSETQDVNGQPLPGGVIIYGNTDLVNGVATLQITSFSNPGLPAGPHVLVATYGGDAGNVNYLGNSSSFVTVTISPDLNEGKDKAVLKISVVNSARSGDQVTVNLKIENTGTAAALDANITDVVVKALTGQGTSTVLSQLPLPIGPLAPSASIVRSLYLTVPTSVQRISLTESGNLRDINNPSAAFSAAQMIIP